MGHHDHRSLSHVETARAAALAAAQVEGGAAAPSSSAPNDRLLLGAYSEWLRMERRLLHMELFPDADPCARDCLVPAGIDLARAFHLPAHPERWQDRPQPSTRADLVLRAVGCFSGAVAPEGFERIERDGQTWFRQGPVDPIYAVINAYETARAARIRAEKRDDDNAWDAGLVEEEMAVEAIAATRPTTTAGLTAAAVHLASIVTFERSLHAESGVADDALQALLKLLLRWSGDDLSASEPPVLHAAE